MAEIDLGLPESLSLLSMARLSSTLVPMDVVYVLFQLPDDDRQYPGPAVRLSFEVAK